MSFIYGSATIYQSATRFEQSFLCSYPFKLNSVKQPFLCPAPI
jgi:hypothetical protein